MHPCDDCDGTGRIDCPEAAEDHDPETCPNNCDGAGFACLTCDGTGEEDAHG
jgi:hypothetical protein